MNSEEIDTGNMIIEIYMRSHGDVDQNCMLEYLQNPKLEYHKRWDALMLVLEKINLTHNKKAEGGVAEGRDLLYTLLLLLGSGYVFTEYWRDSLPMTIENVWLRAIEYIKYLNQKK